MDKSILACFFDTTVLIYVGIVNCECDYGLITSVTVYDMNITFVIGLFIAASVHMFHSSCRILTSVYCCL